MVCPSTRSSFQCVLKDDFDWPHLLLLPVIVSLTYELNRVVGRYDNRLTRLVSAPGMWLQNWTTFEPDDSMIEVGIRAFTLVLPEEKGKDQW